MVSQEYLARYMSSDPVKVSKHRSKHEVKKGSRIRIVDVDEFARPQSAAVKPEIEEEFEEEETKPIIALSNNPTDELRLLGKFKTSSWSVNEDVPSTSSAQEAATGSQMKTYAKIKMKIKKEPGLSEDEDDACAVVQQVPQKKRRSSHHLDEDLSPPRSRRSASGVPKTERHQLKSLDDGDSDLSIRRRRKKISEEPLGPKRHADDDHGSGSDLSPQRRKGAKEEHPIRRRHRDDDDADDLSPDRRHRRHRSSSRSRQESEETAAKTVSFSLSQSSGGIRSLHASQTKKNVLKEEHEMELRKSGPDLGEHAETVVRKKMTKPRKPELTEEQKQMSKMIEEKFQLWNRGLKQHEIKTEKLQEMAKEINKPLARYRDDTDLENMLKAQELKEDPMLEYIQRKKNKNRRPELPKYTGPLPPPNRFGIPPGYRWDGLDRSNGFEDKLLSQKNLRKAEEEEYYKWSSGTYE